MIQSELSHLHNRNITVHVPLIFLTDKRLRKGLFDHSILRVENEHIFVNEKMHQR